MKWILRFFSTRDLWREVWSREHATVADEVEAGLILKKVFYSTPDYALYLRRREMKLLQSLTLKDKSSDFVEGQIFENRLVLAMDVGTKAEPKVDIKLSEKPRATLEQFLGKFKTDNGKKEDVAEGGVSRSEARPAAHSGQDQKKEG
jgi:hypothetical protein